MLFYTLNFNKIKVTYLYLSLNVTKPFWWTSRFPKTKKLKKVRSDVQICTKM